MQPIRFPGLGLEFFIDRTAFTIFGLPIYWYGIIISTGFLLGLMIAIFEAKRTGLDPEIIMDVALYGTPAAIVGARLYYVIFYGNLSEIFLIRQGGLAIYGAIIAALISTIIYCKIKRINVWKVFDIGTLGLIIAQAIGRWGNFVNQEAYGGPTSLPWRMEIYDAEAQARIAVHPTFLYESLWNLLGFVFLMWYRKRKKFEGEMFLLYAFWYGLGRFWIEGLRTDSLYWGSFRVSQVVAAVSVILSIGLMISFRKKTSNI
ncbi:MAG: phosphatidylglycerol---prolipoprotein diacylglyceryl transferase [Petroclostridium sp.]|jgi:phosphatidylglycerol:prolipoprotein diacylglycerol transferase|uniref:prolipoprotein diacylglyceryl transferase n=1 Tax=Petroclostridium xylanilyticum TaxID=1792311 RepID=UPI001FA8C942|nr:prolipoprotein diacylglyceryl transferase [Petroclostridium xylanilyticum]MBZ4644966.1 prolipoprotein diacylglyceryl transferase [Clostridia bacterium]MDK2809915.1 phosphatidylglycerol---prolipoprotein diacylglyceryl transferase [Petroclostridium sp.]